MPIALANKQEIDSTKELLYNKFMKLKILLSYVGTHYAGWQIQELNKNVLTIQGELEKAFYTLFNESIRIVGASRTDSGVHAIEQCAHCTISSKPKDIAWNKALNNLLPEDIRIKSVEIAEDNFQAHVDSIGKIYKYSLWTDRDYIDPRLAPFAWVRSPLNYKKMQEASVKLLGEHDFASFQNVGTDVDTTIRTIHKIEFKHISDKECEIYFYGNGFLKQMVRNLVGFLVHVGSNKLEVDTLEEILEAKKRTNIFPTAPAHGLTLVKVLYEEA